MKKLLSQVTTVIPAPTTIDTPHPSPPAPTIPKPVATVPVPTSPVTPTTNPSASPLPSLFPTPTSGISSSSSSSASAADESAVGIKASPTPIPSPSPTPLPLQNILRNTVNAIRAPIATLLQQPVSSYQYNDRALSARSSLSLLSLSALLIISSFIFLKYMKNTVGRYWYIFLILGIAIIIGVLYLGSSFQNRTRSFSSYTLLSSSWEKYKERFIKKDGRVVDENNTTTSEGQSYAMLQSVWADDMKTFDTVWRWTAGNLKRPKDSLFGWRYGKKPDNTLGFLPNGGDNSASDADSDIAFSLIMASRRWHNPNYRHMALPILNSMWDTEVATASGKMYLTAGNWAQSDSEIVVNPSYFSPYAWRVFAQEDRSHNWASLIQPSYDLLQQVGQNPLDKGYGVGLPPDWLSVSKDTGQIHATNLQNLDSNYSFDALRIPWRIALDYQQYGEKQAYAYLQSLGFLVDAYAKNNRLNESYSHDGKPISNGENPVMYATALGAFMYARPDLAQKMYQDKILNLYSTDSNSFKQNLSYYEENWLWFGSALYLKVLYKF